MISQFIYANKVIARIQINIDHEYDNNHKIVMAISIQTFQQKPLVSSANCLVKCVFELYYEHEQM